MWDGSWGGTLLGAAVNDPPPVPTAGFGREDKEREEKEEEKKQEAEEEKDEVWLS